jgi:hypothetical protein
MPSDLGVGGGMIPRPVEIAGIRLLMRRLADQGVHVWLFGGWAEEVRGLMHPRAHKDVDLLYLGADFAALDAFMRSARGVREVAVKRTPCSRAFEANGDFVEFYLVQADKDGLFTDFWGYIHRWPADTLSQVAELPVASVPSLEGSRSVWRQDEQAYDAYAASQR